MARNFVAEAGRIAANEHARGAFDFAIAEDECVRRAGIFDEPAIDVAAQFPEFFANRRGKELFVGDDAGVGNGCGGSRIVEEFAEFVGAGFITSPRLLAIRSLSKPTSTGLFPTEPAPPG